MNYKAGIFLQQLSKLRGIYYTYKAFEDAVLFEKNEAARVVLIDLCLLFGIT